jgi:hypothetical protein
MIATRLNKAKKPIHNPSLAAQFQPAIPPITVIFPISQDFAFFSVRTSQLLSELNSNRDVHNNFLEAEKC